ncbi:alpha/beta fold hydrolase [Marmoricola sp. RAF53]|uniref:alpha/beta fold hydrolase n=1 Tax=Marmoricola sp. RAF53 TaxID=3233059 RepID=UPI003F97E4A8
MTLIQVNGKQVNIEDTGTPAGDPDAPVLVMGHGLLFSTSMWREQVAALRASYRCVTVDWCGQGATPAVPGGADMDSLYADLVGVIEHLDVGPVHYLGLSMGGFVGLRLAARRPDLVRTLTLIDTSSGPEDPDKVKKYRLLGTIYGLVGLKPLLGQVAPIMFTPAFLRTPAGKDVVATWVGELGGQPRRGTKQAILGVVDREPVHDEIGAITAPTLVIVGAEDVATPVAKAKRIAASIPGARLETLPGVGHVSTLEAPQAVNALILPFLAAHA